ncbi:conserved hypothetical protein (plasmid) [Allochromatium vinosum DSM 180]|uniref:Regulatory protein, FmdB family n=1 Tax=Allochromatium vinosum (strain ATCC 17899 / DSM 180 / NBRC 103801 / NCIMB 10441 / D) TaxID=572477 RepID=D3RWG3_ALLVD|nr:conserved hypothetical protein [Allochromatium vinosum DSM 180]
MPIRPQPRTYRCPQCGWSTTVHPKSDALKPSEYFSECPSCGHQDLHTESTPLALTLAGQLFSRISRLRKP